MQVADQRALDLYIWYLILISVDAGGNPSIWLM